LTSEDPFIAEAKEQWGATGLLLSANKTSMCNNIPILGGPGILQPTGGSFKRFYSSFKAHDTLYFRINIFLIDNWQPDETIFVVFDNQTFTTGNISASIVNFSQDLCGDPSFPDLDTFTIMGKMDHFLPNVTLQIYPNTTLSSSQVSFGIRNVSILIGNRSLSEAFDVFPQSCNLANVSILDNQCSCPRGTYLYTNQTDNTTACLPCDSSCKDCYGPSNTQCYACNSPAGYSYVVNKCILCDPSCADCTGPRSTQCIKCHDYVWMNANRTCTSVCNSPVNKQVMYGPTYICQELCQNNEYYYFNSTCIATCPSPLVTSKGYFGYFCNLPCSKTQFLSWNKTCLTNCPSPMVQGNFEDVVFPCNKPCAAGEYYYNNDGVCRTTCPSPLVSEYDSNKILRCRNPCNDTSYYFYDYYVNSTCNATCPDPLKPSLFLNITKVCSLPCQANEYLYQSDRSCQATCPSPLVSLTDQNGVLWCNHPCDNSSDFYYDFNRSCHSQCPFPFVFNRTFQNFIKICTAPCPSGSIVYLNGTCSTFCEAPLVPQMDADGYYICVSPCSNYTNSYYYTLNNSCTSVCNAPSYIENKAFYNQCTYVEPQSESALASLYDSGSIALTASTVVMQLVGQSNPATTTIAGYIKMVPYLRYMKIHYPIKLQIMLNNMNSSLVTLNLGISASQSFQNKFPKYPLPGKFDEYGFHSSFIVNYWGNFSTIFIMLGVIAILSGCIYLAPPKHQAAKAVFNGIRLMIKWNFFIIFYCGNLDGIVLSTSLQMRNAHFGTASSGISVIMCLIMNLFTMFLFGLAFYIIHDIRKNRKILFQNCVKNHQEVNWQAPEKKWREFQPFFKGSKRDKWIRHVFIIPFLLRIYIFNVIIAYLFDYPLVQAILIFLLSLTMLAFLITQRPFVSKLVLLQHTTDEIIMLTVNSALVALAILDASHSSKVSLRNNLGLTIIIANLIFNISANIYMLSYVLTGLIQAYHVTRVHKKQGLLAWFTAFMGPFESGGMDLEVIIPIAKDETTNKLVTHPSSPQNHSKGPSNKKPLTIETSHFKKKTLYVKANDSQISPFARETPEALDENLSGLNIFNNHSSSSPMSPAGSVFGDGQLWDMTLTGKRKSTFARRKLLAESRLNSFHLDVPKTDKSEEVEEFCLSPRIIPDYRLTKRTQFKTILEPKDSMSMSSNLFDQNPSTSKELIQPKALNE